MTDPIKKLVLRHADAGEIARAASEGGMITMLDDGLRKALAGITSIEEVQRVTQEQVQSQNPGSEKRAQSNDIADGSDNVSSIASN